jgi:hypothetical protein
MEKEDSGVGFLPCAWTFFTNWEEGKDRHLFAATSLRIQLTMRMLL